jgi:hypothetical protein
MRKLRRYKEKQPRKRRFARCALTAGAAAAITLGVGANVEKAHGGADPHQLTVRMDADADLLASREEFAIGYMPFNPDQNLNLVLDGSELANRCAAAIIALPMWWPGEPRPAPVTTHRIEHAVDGIEQCDVCGQWIHMGGWKIVNPALNLDYPDPNDAMNAEFLPDLAIHYMTHGSFDCSGSVHRGRVDIQRLMRVLELRFPFDPNEHQLPVDGNDLDADLLTDLEELAAGYDLYDPDQDDNLTADGIDLAGQCAEVVDQLPVYDPYGGAPLPKHLYKENFFQKGLENCHICGKNVNMGFWKVVNPNLEISIEVPDIVCHYMSHGSFSYSGDVHGKGRIDVALLARILEMPGRCGDLGTLYLPGDFNRDCKEDFKDFTGFAEKWLQLTDPAQISEPQINYTVENCDLYEPPAGQATETSPPPLAPPFSVKVEGAYVHFEHTITANCCPEDITLEMTATGNLITITEVELLNIPCPCICDYPARATLGPFDSGTYYVGLYRLTRISGQDPSPPSLVGKATITIDPPAQ